MSDTPSGTPEPEPVRVRITRLDPSHDEDAAAILAACTAEGTIERGREILDGARGDSACEIYGLFEGEELAAVYVLKKVSFANEIAYLAVREDRRRRGHGRACLHDALFRSGRRPITVEADDRTVGFYKACGFKLVGKRTGPGGATRYRLGWHAPRPRPVTGTGESGK